ncbi:TetR/AcrR family transcriptional regulator [Nocardia sp. NPDC003482]|uniref:TetR/AcrR family transcriptional regulator n=1 Tax=Nocardia sp. NPDC004068 TaxID=3364303 RepID=UPI0036BB7B4C
MITERRVNRGPAAARENRAALVAAAREVLAEYGTDAPLALIAQRAGVGKGSLYRHFPTRDAVVVAVFEDNVTELEELAARPEATAETVIDAIIGQITESMGFIAVLNPATMSDDRLQGPLSRVMQLLTTKLADPGSRGGLRADLTVEDAFVAIAMLGALLHKTAEPDRPAVLERARRLLDRALRA